MTPVGRPNRAMRGNSGLKIRILAVIDKKGLAELPGAPTIFQDVPGYNLSRGWFGLFGPAGLPSPIASRLQSEFKKAIQAPDLQAKLEKLGMSPGGNSPQEFSKDVQGLLESIGKIVKDLKLEAQ